MINNKTRRVSTLFRSLPHELYNEIVSFIGNSKDFFSIMRVTKNLYELFTTEKDYGVALNVLFRMTSNRVYSEYEDDTMRDAYKFVYRKILNSKTLPYVLNLRTSDKDRRYKVIKLFDRCVNVKYITLDYFNKSIINGLKDLKNLYKLKMNPLISDEILKDISLIKNITHLDIYTSRWTSSTRIFCGFNHLEFLILFSPCHLIGDKELRFMVNLKYIIVKRSNLITKKCVKYLPKIKRALLKKAKKKSNLYKRILSYNDGVWTDKDVKCNDLKYIVFDFNFDFNLYR